MPILTRSCIDKIKATVSIHDVVAPYVELKRSGANWRGLSPFSDERTPSFYALTHKNIFKCFSTGHAGDVFKFIQLKENLSFQEAAEYLAKRFNLPLEYEALSQGQSQALSQRKQLLRIHELAQAYFEACLWGSEPSAALVRDYALGGRGFLPETLRCYGVGFCPEQPQLAGPLLKQLRHEGLDQPECLSASGLFYGTDRPGQLPRLRFRGRLMLPVRDAQGRPIAFAARQTPATPPDDPSAQAKYINSPQTLLFDKSHVIFGLDVARKALQDPDATCLLVEGPLDVMRCYQCGFKGAVAPQGTAVTQSQLAILRRYRSTLHVCLDGDAAGRRAALRLLPLGLHEQLDMSFVKLPEGEDPDTLLAKQGPAALQQHLAQALGPMAFAYQELCATHAVLTPQAKADVIQHMGELLAKVPLRVARQAYTHELAALAGLDPYGLEAELERTHPEPLLTPVAPAPRPAAARGQKLTSAEYELLLVVLNHEELIQPIVRTLPIDWIRTHTLHGQLLLRILDAFAEGGRQALQPLDDFANDETEYNTLYTLWAQESPFPEPHQAAQYAIGALHAAFFEQAQDKLDAALTQTSDPLKKRQLMEERRALRLQKKLPPQLPEVQD
jgi:DNA primase